MNIWMIGKPIIGIDGKELGWSAEGCFLEEQAAAYAAKDDEFIVLAKIGERFPSEALDAIKIYYPKQETWETSALYKMRSTNG